VNNLSVAVLRCYKMLKIDIEESIKNTGKTV